MGKYFPVFRAVLAFTAAATAVSIGLRTFPADVGGEIYDRLMDLRPPRPAPGTLLLVDTGQGANQDGTVEPGRLASALLAMKELEAAYVVVQAPISLGDSNQGKVGGYLERRFDEEFDLINHNIRTLFEGIRLGSIRPGDAERFVGEIGALVEASKRRLLSAGVDTGDEGARLLEQTANALGLIWAAEDLSGAALIRPPSKAPRSPVPSAALEGVEAGAVLPTTTFSRVKRDEDGAIRSFMPLVRHPGFTAKHVAYAALLDHTGNRDFRIDPEAPLILVVPRKRDSAFPFRKVALEDFSRYQEWELKLHADLKEMERSGYFAALDPLSYPTTLYEYALSLRAELLIAPTAERTAHWKASRHRFFSTVETVLTGPTLQTILAGYDALGEQEDLNEEGRARITGLKELASQSFEWARSSFRELISLRENLSTQVRGSFILIGPLFPKEHSRTGMVLGETEASAALISTLLSDTRISPATPELRRNAALFPAAAAVLISAFFPPWAVVILCAAAAALCAAASALLFLRWDIWLHPAIPTVGVVAVGVAAGVAVGAAALSRRVFRPGVQFRAFSGRLRPDILTLRAAAGEDFRSPRVARAAVLAIRRTTPVDSHRDLFKAAADARRFREDSAATFRNAGAAVLRTEGDFVFAAFGSPLDAGHGVSGKEAALTACREALGFLEQKNSHSGVGPMGDPELAADYHIGIDLGDCVFEYTDLGGYYAHGQAPVNARIFSILGARYGVGVLVGKALVDALGGKLRTTYLGALMDKSGGEERPFYALTGPMPV